MRSIPLLLLISLISSTNGCAGAMQGQQTAGADVGSTRESNGDSGVSALVTRKEKQSYALGMDYGKRLRYQAVKIDPAIFMRGLKDTYSSGKILMTEGEARTAMLELQGEIKKKQAPPEVVPQNGPSDIRISFKLDPRITQGMYMGDRWVSPPTYTRVGEGQELTFEARVPDVPDRQAQPQWVPSDPEMVTVTPNQGNAVRITVRRPGQSTLKVVSAGTTKELAIQAVQNNGTIQVNVTQ